MNINNNLAAYPQQTAQALTLMLLAMMAERYLDLEDETSSKMALELSAEWECR